VSLALQQALKTKARLNIFVTLESTEATLNQLSIRAQATHGERATAVYNALKALATKSQAPVLEMLASPKFFALNVQSFWITNQVYIQGADAYLIESLAFMDDVSSIEEEQIVYLDDPVEVSEEMGTLAEWGVDKIQTEQAWAALGSQGQGAVVAVIDTGARATHNFLSASYRGGNHAWYNPYQSQANPGDGHGHGTHCTGTIAGSNGIGVAPGAKWISCKGLQDNGSGTNAGLIACGQFVACPHNYNGQNPDCNQAPDVVSNSWGGTGGQTWFDAVIRSWHAAGIIPIFANGNSGAACRTTLSPGDSAADVIAVGATAENDAIASFSSRGPANSGIQKPQVSAPGVNVRSAGISSDAAYATMSGTSMACPHTAGLATLLRAGNRNVSYNTVKNILQDTADRNLVFSGQVCSGQADNVWPNYTFGYGRINALRAVNALLAMIRNRH